MKCDKKKDLIIGLILVVLVISVLFIIFTHLNNNENGELIYQRDCFGCPTTYISNEWNFIDVYTTGPNYTKYFDPYIDESGNANFYLTADDCCGYFNSIRIVRENETIIINVKYGTFSNCNGCAAPDKIIVKGPAKGAKYIEVNYK